MKNSLQQQLKAFKQVLEAEQGEKSKPAQKQREERGNPSFSKARKDLGSNRTSSVKESYLAYDFIDITPTAPKYSYEQRGDLTGILTVEVKALTPIIAIEEYRQHVANQQTRNYQGNPQILPASSIRGMIRSVAEIMWDEVVTITELRDSQGMEIHDKNYSGSEKEEGFLPEDIRLASTTTTALQHRLAVHLFGFTLTAKEDSEEQESSKTEPTSISSVLTFTDAVAVGKNRVTEAFIAAQKLGEPRGLYNKGIKQLNAFYFKDKQKSQLAGRKLYLAGRIEGLKLMCFATRASKELEGFVGEMPREPKTGQKNEPIPVRLIHPQSAFTMKIYFKQLTKEHLAALIRVIELTPNATHAIGRGKPFGFGRLQLKVTAIHLQTVQSFFDLSQKTANQLLDKEELLKLPNPFEKRLKEIESRTDIKKFDNRKAYMPAQKKKNEKQQNKKQQEKIVKQYFRNQNG